MDFVKELAWRGMIHQKMPGVEDAMRKEKTTGYIGFDPTADSLHVGSLVQIMILVHFQRCGHKPIAVMGGATGMVGDPSGKSEERNLLSADVLEHNLQCCQKQLEKFLDFDCGETSAEVVNNWDWMKEFSFLEFLRDVGKHMSINVMLSKDSVKTRLETGLSFTEFAYQLVQGYDFVWLNKNKNCKVQLGGSDQWGNIVAGTELIRKMTGNEAFAITTPLITKADGVKFGKTESGNVWLDRHKTSPYKFYQYWINSSDEDAKKYIRIFTTKERSEIEILEAEHDQDPGRRLLQKELAKDITVRVHSEDDYSAAVNASEILFKKGQEAVEGLKQLPEELFTEVFDGVPQVEINKSELTGTDLVSLLADKSGFLKSNGEARRAVKENSISVNKEKVQAEYTVSTESYIQDKYILLQRGKKNYFLVKAID